MVFISQLFVSFFVVFIKALQTQVVVKGSRKTAFALSILMTVSSTINIILVVENTWASLLPIAIGSGIGVVFAMTVYRKAT